MATPFDLSAYFNKKFPSLSLGGGLLHRWPISVRFELGLENFRERAPKLYENVFATDDTCVVISQGGLRAAHRHLRIIDTTQVSLYPERLSRLRFATFSA
jgi:hypothetical protein